MDHSRLSETREEDLVQYGAISPLAVSALLLGIVSFLALAQLLLLILPVAAIITALVALGRIGRSDGALVGKPVAAIGLALAVLFASAALARTYTRGRLLHQQARQFADDWLRLVRDGDLQQAHQLHLPERKRQLPGAALKEYYASSEGAQQDLENAFSQPLLKQIAQEQAQWRFLEFAQHLPERNTDRLDLNFELQPTKADSRPYKFTVVVERIGDSDGGAWRLLSISPDDFAATE